MGNSTSELEPQQKLIIVQNSKPDLQFDEESSDKNNRQLMFIETPLQQELKSSVLDQSISYAQNNTIYESLIQKEQNRQNILAQDGVSVFEQQSIIQQSFNNISRSALEQHKHEYNVNFSNQTIDESY